MSDQNPSPPDDPAGGSKPGASHSDEGSSAGGSDAGRARPQSAGKGIGIIPATVAIAALVLLYVYIAKPNPAAKDAAKATTTTREVLLDAKRAAAVAAKREAAGSQTNEPSVGEEPAP